MKYLTTTQAAHYMGVHKTTIIQWHKSGRLLPITTIGVAGTHRRYTMEQLEEYKQSWDYQSRHIEQLIKQIQAACKEARKCK